MYGSAPVIDINSLRMTLWSEMMTLIFDAMILRIGSSSSRARTKRFLRFVMELRYVSEILGLPFPSPLSSSANSRFVQTVSKTKACLKKPRKCNASQSEGHKRGRKQSTIEREIAVWAPTTAQNAAVGPLPHSCHNGQLPIIFLPAINWSITHQHKWWWDIYCKLWWWRRLDGCCGIIGGDGIYDYSK